ncbi:hypothetical protein [Streptomyces sp. MMBL 11-3]|uniref:hypothetical protein n=1 Tax=Streptomyces sp. MMBL 11-3 TaxID=3382639 RepID=UPI0039B39CAC
MREGRTVRRAETVGRPSVTGPAPQWQNLFLAPAYRGDVAEEIEADWRQEKAAAAPVQRRRRGGRRTTPAAA